MVQSAIGKTRDDFPDGRLVIRYEGAKLRASPARLTFLFC